MAEFVAETEALLPSMSHDDRVAAFGKAFLVRRYRVKKGEDRPTFGLDNPWVSMGASPEFLGIVNAYRGEPMRLHDVDNWYTVPDAEAARSASQRWHRDGWENHIVKVFTYFNEVDEEAGPVRVRPRQRRRRPVRLALAVGGQGGLPAAGRARGGGRPGRLPAAHRRARARSSSATRAASTAAASRGRGRGSSRTTRTSPTRASSATGGSSRSTSTGPTWPSSRPTRSADAGRASPWPRASSVARRAPPTCPPATSATSAASAASASAPPPPARRTPRRTRR